MKSCTLFVISFGKQFHISSSTINLKLRIWSLMQFTLSHREFLVIISTKAIYTSVFICTSGNSDKLFSNMEKKLTIICLPSTLKGLVWMYACIIYIVPLFVVCISSVALKIIRSKWSYLPLTSPALKLVPQCRGFTS